MKKFLSFSLKHQWKTVLIIFALIAVQTFFQMEIIDLFSAALSSLSSFAVLIFIIYKPPAV
mgnify:CR=1 FL=1